MSFNWDFYIRLAGELIRHQKTPSIQEAYFRTAMSRSYYGVFCLARDILINKGIKVPKSEIHNFVRTKYQKCPNKMWKKIAKDLRRSWRDRLAADYKGNAIIDKNRAETSYQLSLRLLRNLRKL